MNGEVISLQDAWDKMQSKDAVYLDVRSTREFAAGHPAGAYHIPLIEMAGGGQEMNQAFVAEVKALVAQLGDDGPDLIVACQAGGRSKQACQLLAAEGITKTYDFAGGWGGRAHPFGGPGVAGWGSSDLPTATTAETGRDWPSLKRKTNS